MKKFKKRAAAILSAALALSVAVTSGVGYPEGGDGCPGRGANYDFDG